MNLKETRPYLGNFAQLLDVKDYKFEGGRADGVRATDITTSTGLSVTVTADRAMDFSSVRFKGINIGYMTPVGVASPFHYQHDGPNFLRNFTAGFLTTCGLTSIGSPSEDQGESFGQHGRFANIPAEEYSVKKEITDDDITVHISGIMRQVCFFGENISLKREITINNTESIIRFTDTVKNEDLYKVPYMHLYHFNIGYPLLSPDTKIYIPSLSVRARTPYAEQGINDWNHADEASYDIEEMCYYHEVKKLPNGRVGYVAYNHALHMGVLYEYDGFNLDWYNQWKCMKSGAYVMGIEPCNGCLEGRDVANREKTLKYLEPSEEKKLDFVIEFFEGDDKLEEFIQKYELKR